MTTYKIGGGWWQPWANTVAYYPLTSDANDYSGNWKNLTNYWATFGEYQWVICAFINKRSGYIKWNIDTLPVWASPRTWNFWCYNNNETTQQYEECYFFNGVEYVANQMVLFWIATDNKEFVSQWWSSPNWNITALRKQWFNACIVYNWTKFIYYRNWVNVWEWTYTINTQWTEFRIWGPRTRDAWWDQFVGYMSNFILENKGWTADEVSDYYNQTKANYWL